MVESTHESLDDGARASTLYDQLRADIITARLIPGEKLKIELLRSRYGTSASPLREALNRLAAEGWVERQEQRGFRVANVSIKELNELTRTRQWIEEITLRESLAHGDSAWEETVVLSFYRLSRAPSTLTAVGKKDPLWSQCHRDFHHALLSGCPSKPLLNFAGLLFDSAERYRELALYANGSGNRDVHSEHRDIMKAALDRNHDLAFKLLNEHVAATAMSIESIFDRLN